MKINKNTKNTPLPQINFRYHKEIMLKDCLMGFFEFLGKEFPLKR